MEDGEAEEQLVDSGDEEQSQRYCIAAVSKFESFRIKANGCWLSF